MLIRLVSHGRKGNPNQIDELIRIDGLPDHLIFRMKEGRRYLLPPWEPDVDINIPKSIREHCESVDVSEDLPPEKNEVTGIVQRPVDTRTILGVRLFLDNNPGKEMWTQIERIIDDATPRDRKIPVPAMVAPDQKAPFNLEPEDIPVVNLRPKVETPVLNVAVPVISEKPAIVLPDNNGSTAPQEKVPFNSPRLTDEKASVKFTCGVCEKNFDAQRGLWMHERKTGHINKKEMAVA